MHYYLLKEIHWTLDPTVQLPRPHDPACHWWQVPVNWGVQFLLHVDTDDHFNVPTVVLQNALILLINTKVWDAQSVVSEIKIQVVAFHQKIANNY